jgi:transposase-like protein
VPPRIPDHKRAAILADIRARQKPLRQIARDHAVASSTVHNIARQNGVKDAFDRSRTKKATEAKRVDHQARLVAIAGRSAGLAERALASFEAMTDAEWGKTSPYTRGLIFGIAADKAKDLASDNTDAEQVASALGKFFDGIVDQYGDDYGAA